MIDTEPQGPSKEELKALLRAAWALVRLETPSLSCYVGENDQLERAAAFRLGHHLENLVAVQRLQWAGRFRSCVVDMELTRISGGDQKMGRGQSADAVIHVRGHDDGNLLALEVKPSATGENDTKDLAKLTDLVKDPRRYSHGVRAVLDLREMKLEFSDWIGGRM